VESFFRQVCELLVALERAGRWQEFATSIASFGQLAVELQERRPDVAETIVRAVTGFCSPARVLALIQLYERDSAGRGIATDVMKALGGALVPGFVVLLDDAAHEQRARALTPIFCEHAVKFAPAFEAALPSCGLAATRVAVRVMGHGGVGHEAAVANLVAHEDDQVAREALRALARIGTTAAAALVSRQIREGSIGRRAAAEEALWHFPPGQTAAQVRQFLGSRDFVVQHPQMASRLLDRAAQARTEGLEDVLARLEQLRFRFWKPHVVRVARKARELRVR
jgi:HEAT repeat protein